ncbi:F-box protein At3g07870 [Ricinus communis]|uniref:F-box domain-containing protein n=1 Tax=Ricinus communis TaxID=3988 RepID=B9T208_RICCO|nr:F-box protein At3g07870 [Ricinus communis]EEF30092.1 conserved hypothetical protein [Ricinus communis]|eukprot:XP_002532277.1 F-box protein At3g07870 [Ricinus communis]
MKTDYAMRRPAEEAKIQEHPPGTESLPCELALDILSRLPITHLINVKRVCRFWRSLVQHPLLASMHFSRIANNNDPCLLLLCDLPIKSHLYSLHFSALDETIIETVTRIPVPVIPKFLVIGSCNGLLYLLDSLQQRANYIYNPFTSDYLELPEPGQVLNQHRVATGFGFHSTTKEYKVVRVVYYRNNKEEGTNFQKRRYSLPRSEVQVLTVGNGSLTWRSKGETSYQLLGNPSHVVVNGRLHWLSCRYRNQSLRRLISFDLADEQFREVPCPVGASFGRHCSHLATLRGCLSGVVQGFRRLYIWVMKEYGVKESWVKEFTIGVKLPRELEPYPNQSINLQEFHLPLSQTKVLCLLNNGEILLEFRCGTLVCYDTKSGAFKELIIFQDLPEWSNAIVHVGSLNWIDTPIHF